MKGANQELFISAEAVYSHSCSVQFAVLQRGILWRWRGPSGLRWVWRNGRGPHLEGRQAPQASSLFLTPTLRLQGPCRVGSVDGGAWWAAVHGVAKSWTQLSDFTFIFHFHALEKEMATHSSVLAWGIPGTGEPGGLPSLGSFKCRLCVCLVCSYEVHGCMMLL